MYFQDKSRDVSFALEKRGNYATNENEKEREITQEATNSFALSG